MTKIKDEAPEAKAEGAPAEAAAKIEQPAAEAVKAKAAPVKEEPAAAEEKDVHALALEASAKAHAEIFPAHEEQPQEGGSYVRMPDGTLVREEEA